VDCQSPVTKGGTGGFGPLKTVPGRGGRGRFSKQFRKVLEQGSYKKDRAPFRPATFVTPSRLGQERGSLRSRRVSSIQTNGGVTCQAREITRKALDGRKQSPWPLRTWRWSVEKGLSEGRSSFRAPRTEKGLHKWSHRTFVRAKGRRFREGRQAASEVAGGAPPDLTGGRKDH